MFFDNFFKKKSSGSVAKDRLKLVLVTDRANCSPDLMEQMKKDILKGLDIKITQTESGEGNGSVPALIANIPISEMKVKNS